MKVAEGGVVVNGGKVSLSLKVGEFVWGEELGDVGLYLQGGPVCALVPVGTVRKG